MSRHLHHDDRFTILPTQLLYAGGLLINISGLAIHSLELRQFGLILCPAILAFLIFSWVRS